MGQGSTEGRVGCALYKALRFGVIWGRDCYNLSGLLRELCFTKEGVGFFILVCFGFLPGGHPKVSFKLASVLSGPQSSHRLHSTREGVGTSPGLHTDKTGEEGSVQMQASLDLS